MDSLPLRWAVPPSGHSDAAIVVATPSARLLAALVDALVDDPCTALLVVDDPERLYELRASAVLTQALEPLGRQAVLLMPACDDHAALFWLGGVVGHRVIELDGETRAEALIEARWQWHGEAPPPTC